MTVVRVEQVDEEKQIIDVLGTTIVEKLQIEIKSIVGNPDGTQRENLCILVGEIIDTKKDARRSLKKKEDCEPKSITREKE